MRKVYFVKYKTEYEFLQKRYLSLARIMFVSKKEMLFTSQFKEIPNVNRELIQSMKQEIGNLEVDLHLQGELNNMIRRYLLLESRVYKESQRMKVLSGSASQPFTLKRLQKDFQLLKAKLICALREWEEDNEKKIYVFGKPLSSRLLMIHSPPILQNQENISSNDNSKSSPESSPPARKTTGKIENKKLRNIDVQSKKSIRFPLRLASHEEPLIDRMVNQSPDTRSVSKSKRLVRETSSGCLFKNHSKSNTLSPRRKGSRHGPREPCLSPDASSSSIPVTDIKEILPSQHDTPHNSVKLTGSSTTPASVSLRQMIEPLLSRTPPKGEFTNSLDDTPTQSNVEKVDRFLENHDWETCSESSSASEDQSLCKQLSSFSLSSSDISKKLKNNLNGLHFSSDEGSKLPTFL